MMPNLGSKISPPSPISVAEFYDVFAPLWTRSKGFAPKKRPRLAIAVSGGVDSMALSVLCSALTRYRPAKQRFDFQFEALIIDHKAREGSSEEVERVRQRLCKLGLRPHVKSLTWPISLSPLDLPGFETQARRLRYQALGNICREKNIQYLLLAHHNDDQAETILMRLASGHKGLGLQGMELNEDIPECWGMHGVHRSGQTSMAASRLQEYPSLIHAQNLRRVLAKLSIFEQGGVKILRPLLEFSKERLSKTCRAHALPWEEDLTNKDPWRTPRNNIRALQLNGKLPQALRKTSILQLAKKITDCSRKIYETASIAFNLCEILVLDVRGGGLVVRFPSRARPKPGFLREGAELVYMRKLQFTATLILQKIARIVSPQEDVSLQSLRQAAASVFPELNDEHTETDTRLQPTTFTAGGVQFQRIHCPLSAPVSELNSVNSNKWVDLDPAFVWKLTRQPFSKDPPGFTVQSSANTGFQSADNQPSWSPWCLWDGRYWIRVLNCSRWPLIVRSFQAPDLQYLRSTLSPQRYKDFHQFLHLVVPGKVRWTLLAIAELGDDSLPMGRLLALPTLGPAGTFDTGDSIGTNKVEWQVRYKRISLGFRISDDGPGGDAKTGRNMDLVTSWLD